MTERLTPTYFDDQIAAADTFLGSADCELTLDGAFAASALDGRITAVQDVARQLLDQYPVPQMPDFTLPLGKHNSTETNLVAETLHGYVVLVPSVLVAPDVPSEFYPAVVGKQLQPDSMRLHVLHTPFHSRLQYGESVVLSAAGQYEAPTIGEHDRVRNNAAEAEHFLTILTAGADAATLRQWRSGTHPNSSWRIGQTTGGSVLAEVSQRLLRQDFTQSTIELTAQQIARGHGYILWHKGFEADTATGVETATRQNALLVVQGLGFSAVASARKVDVVKELLQNG